MGRVVYSFNAMHQVVTRIWTLNVVAHKILPEFLSKKRGIIVSKSNRVMGLVLQGHLMMSNKCVKF